MQKAAAVVRKLAFTIFLFSSFIAGDRVGEAVRRAAAVVFQRASSLSPGI
jgi:hypothetical protein